MRVLDNRWVARGGAVTFLLGTAQFIIGRVGDYGLWTVAGIALMLVGATLLALVFGRQHWLGQHNQARFSAAVTQHSQMFRRTFIGQDEYSDNDPWLMIVQGFRLTNRSPHSRINVDVRLRIPV